MNNNNNNKMKNNKMKYLIGVMKKIILQILKFRAWLMILNLDYRMKLLLRRRRKRRRRGKKINNNNKNRNHNNLKSNLILQTNPLIVHNYNCKIKIHI